MTTKYRINIPYVKQQLDRPGWSVKKLAENSGTKATGKGLNSGAPGISRQRIRNALEGLPITYELVAAIATGLEDPVWKVVHPDDWGLLLPEDERLIPEEERNAVPPPSAAQPAPAADINARMSTDGET